MSNINMVVGVWVLYCSKPVGFAERFSDGAELERGCWAPFS